MTTMKIDNLGSDTWLELTDFEEATSYFVQNVGAVHITIAEKVVRPDANQSYFIIQPLETMSIERSVGSKIWAKGVQGDSSLVYGEEG